MNDEYEEKCECDKSFVTFRGVTLLPFKADHSLERGY